ncbi:MAG: Gfo/Idh/MocA family oxidoreductase [Planctomycetaceae bacterium]|nr:Gfo/Idh/MocA family oxidoreductase [Planctomycetaceae bacterium]
MPHQPSRREFLQTAAVTGVGYWVFAGLTPKVSASPNERIAFAGIGCGGKGTSDIANAARFADIVALCDIDKGPLNHVRQFYPKAKVYTDYRKLFDEMEKSVDAATISTPDHMHAPQALMAMRMKKHVYVQKPLARTMYECRLMAKVAKEMGVCSQQGNQGSANDGLRRHATEMKAGVYGDIKEIHFWTNHPVWLQGPHLIRTMAAYEAKVRRDKPAEANQLIANMQRRMRDQLNNIDWELWLGVAKPREFFPGEGGLYHPFHWRGWWDFGSGGLGDIACHALNPHQKALDLQAPVSVVARTTGHDFDAFPVSSEIVFEYPDTPTRKGFKLVWYDGGWFPSREFAESHGFTYPETMPGGGEVIIGSEGVRGWGRVERKQGVVVPEVQLAPHYLESDGSVPERQDDDVRNMFELITAIKENKPELCFSNIPEQGGPLAEGTLLGNLAVWTASKPNEWGEKVMWDSASMTITNLADIKTPGVAELIKPVYRQGYTLD